MLTNLTRWLNFIWKGTVHMKIYYDTNGDASVVIQLSRKEAQKLDDFLHAGLHPKDNKPLTKQHQGYKIAKKISDEMCIW